MPEFSQGAGIRGSTSTRSGVRRTASSFCATLIESWCRPADQLIDPATGSLCAFDETPHRRVIAGDRLRHEGRREDQAVGDRVCGVVNGPRRNAPLADHALAAAALASAAPWRAARTATSMVPDPIGNDSALTAVAASAIVLLPLGTTSQPAGRFPGIDDLRKAQVYPAACRIQTRSSPLAGSAKVQRVSRTETRPGGCHCHRTLEMTMSST